MKSMCFKENIQISNEDLDRLIESTNQDIRQVINHLALFVGQTGSQEKNEKKHINKDLRLGPWDVVKKVFSIEEHKHMSISDKSSLFFHDYNIAPLFVQENYLMVIPQVPKYVFQQNNIFILFHIYIYIYHFFLLYAQSGLRNLESVVLHTRNYKRYARK